MNSFDFLLLSNSNQKECNERGLEELNWPQEKKTVKTIDIFTSAKWQPLSLSKYSICVGVESIDNNLKFSIKNFFMCMWNILKEEVRGVLSLRFPILMSSYRNRRFLWSRVSAKKTSDNLHRIRCLGPA